MVAGVTVAWILRDRLWHLVAFPPVRTAEFCVLRVLLACYVVQRTGGWPKRARIETDRSDERGEASRQTGRRVQRAK